MISASDSSRAAEPATSSFVIAVSVIRRVRVLTVSRAFIEAARSARRRSLSSGMVTILP